ncbi:MAG TPA: divergent PAP2 family protein [Candidatus Obscuribacterales bacterium]
MQDISAILDNRILIVALLACITAQVIKPFIELIQHGKFNVRAVVESGGMPSSHSALVTALAAGVGQSMGWQTVEFAIASVFAIIVLYDAMGVRQAAGKQARLINQMIDELFSDRTEFNEDRLKEILGHTPLEVLVGSLLGLLISWLAAPAY